MKYKELTEKSSVVPTEFATECIMVFLLIFGRRKVEIKRKVKDFDEDLQDAF
ncbi:MAG: hypothetical protein KAU60_15350 [Desulfobacterales bacterium]|nr:hypothetical protein [Desulfobacterales bacterium]